MWPVTLVGGDIGTVTSAVEDFRVHIFIFYELHLLTIVVINGVFNNCLKFIFYYTHALSFWTASL